MHSQIESVTALGAELRRVREQLNLRQDEVALAAGVATRTVHAVENGKETTRADVLFRLIDTLGLELSLGHRGPR
jgi:transcriptional regulator with XRE-family HTH domain